VPERLVVALLSLCQTDGIVAAQTSMLVVACPKDWLLHHLWSEADRVYSGDVRRCHDRNCSSDVGRADRVRLFQYLCGSRARQVETCLLVGEYEKSWFCILLLVVVVLTVAAPKIAEIKY
jgi:hypothetical protein